MKDESEMTEGEKKDICAYEKAILNLSIFKGRENGPVEIRGT